MFDLFKLNLPIGRSYNTDPDDVRKTKKALSGLGYYEEPDFGITPYPDTSMMNGLENFQRDFGLRLDGVMKPGGETAQMLGSANHINAQNLQSLGRNGDSILAHITPSEARLLKQKGGAGTINPKTGLLEFSKESKKEREYIWRTEGDSKVRSSHAERNGKTFSWDNPPEGGHPGEALNCRCTAEDVKPKKRHCIIEKLDLREIVKILMPLAFKLKMLNGEIKNIRLRIESLWAEIKVLESLAVAVAGASAIGSAAGKIASEIEAVRIANQIREIEDKIQEKNSELQPLETERSILEPKVKSLEHREAIAQQAYDKCMGTDTA